MKNYRIIHIIIQLFLCFLGTVSGPLLPQVSADLTGIGSTVNLNAGVYEITNGTVVGTNLFHSFEEFSIHSGETAHFMNGAVDHVIARVTGGYTSNIDGTLKVDHSANLFIINPAGFIFGPDAALDVGGSVHITSSDYLALGTSGRYDAKDPSNDVLTTGEISGFGFISEVPGEIEIQGSTLQVPDGERLEFTCGNFSAFQNTYTALLAAPSGSISIVSVASSGLWNGEDISAFSELGNIHLSDWSEISIAGSGTEGGIYIRGNHLILEASDINAVTDINAGMGNRIDILLNGSLLATGGGGIINGTTDSGDAGDITIQAEEVTLDSGSYIENVNLQDPLDDSKTGATGDIIIKAGSLTLDGEAYLDNSSYTAGPMGDISIDVAGDIRLVHSAIYSNVAGTGNGGQVRINCGGLHIQQGGAVDLSVYGAGSSSRLEIIADSEIVIDGYLDRPSGIYNDLVRGYTGSGSSIRITSSDLCLTGGGVIACRTRTDQKGSSIVLEVADELKIDGYFLTGENEFMHSSIRGGTQAAGNGGDITITADKIEISAGGQIVGSSSGAGVSSNIAVNSTGIINLSGTDLGEDYYGDEDELNEASSGIISGSWDSGDGGVISIASPELSLSSRAVIEGGTWSDGNSGDINIQVGTLNIQSGGEISAESLGSGNGGAISINAGESIHVSGFYLGGDEGESFEIGSRISSGNQGPGASGRIDISSPAVTLSDYGTVACGAWGTGPGGTITINADTLILTRYGCVNSASWGQGQGGDMIFNLRRLNLSEWASFDSSGFEGTGGNILVNASESVSLDAAYIESGAYGKGDAGNITIKCPEVRMANSAYVSSETLDVGNGGDIGIDAARIWLGSGAWITGKSKGSGMAGNITLNASDRIEMDHGKIYVLSEQEDGGDIVINTDYWLKMTDSRITAEVKGGSGNGGNISIDPTYVILMNSQIIANAFGGTGGNIRIISGLFIRDAASIISASSRLGIDGEIEISAPDVDISGSVKELPSAVLISDSLLPKRCEDRNPGDTGSFVLTGSSGFPPDPAMLIQLP